MMLKLVSNRIINKSPRWKAIAIAFCVIAIILISWGTHNIFNLDMSNKVYERVVDYESLNIRVVIRARALGIGGSSKITVSEYPYNEKLGVDGSQGHELLTFEGIMELYYKKKNESTLVVYVSAEGIPQHYKMQSSKLRIELNELKSYDELKLYESNFKQYGLLKISVYSEESMGSVDRSLIVK